MPTEAIITLEDLECIAIKDLETQVEPYIWPVLIKVDTSTISSSDRRFVDVIALSSDLAGVVIKHAMRQGELAPIPSSVAQLRARFEDDVTSQQLILIVALLEMDETPRGAMRAGFKAYVGELRAAFKDEFPKLFQAESVRDEEAAKEIISRIKDRVESKTREAIEDAVSLSDKGKTFLGFVDNDDFISSSVTRFGENFFLNVPTFTPMTLVFQKKRDHVPGPGPLPRFVSTFVRYHIRGSLRARPVRPVVPDRCQSQVNAVKDAQAVVDGIEKEIKALQNIEDHSTKGSQRAEIERIRHDELAPALAALTKAQTALQLCRS